MLSNKSYQAKISPATFAMVTDPDWHLYPHVAILDDLLNFLDNRDIHRLMNWMPPQHGKSQLTSINFPVWYLGTHPEDRFLHASYEAEFAKKWFGGPARNKFDEFAEEIFDLKLDKTSNSKDHWDIADHKGGYDCAGVGGAFTGMKGDAINIDDPHKNRTEAKSKVKQETAYEWYQETVDTRLSNKGILNLIQTRWDIRDLSGRIMEVEPYIYAREALDILEDGGKINEDEWVILDMPALSKGEGDILNRPEGVALCEELHTTSQLLGKMARMPPQRFSALYQCSPVPDSGEIFERDYFEVIPWEKYIQYYYPHIVRTVRCWDLAGTLKKESANTAGVLAGITDHLEFVILDVITTKGKPGAVRDLIYETGLADGRKTQIIVAHDPGQAGIDQMERYEEKLRGLNFKPFKERDIGSKEERAQNHATEGELHKIYVLQDYGRKWNDEYIEEHIDFPQGRFKDRVDGTSMAYAVLFKAGQQHIKAHKIFGKLAGE